MNAVQIERLDKYEKKKKVKISEGKRWTDMFKLSLAYKTYSINSYWPPKERNRENEREEIIKIIMTWICSRIEDMHSQIRETSLS